MTATIAAVLAGWRDATATPSGGHGRAEKAHIAVIHPFHGHQTAACSGATLVEDWLWPAAMVPAHRRCRRNGCAGRWPNPEDDEAKERCARPRTSMR